MRTKTENNSYAKIKVVHFISYGVSGYNLFASGKKGGRKKWNRKRKQDKLIPYTWIAEIQN